MKAEAAGEEAEATSAAFRRPIPRVVARALRALGEHVGAAAGWRAAGRIARPDRSGLDLSSLGRCAWTRYARRDVEPDKARRKPFDQYTEANAKQRIINNIGAGALVYEGAQGVDNDAVSFWKVSLYGGLKMASDDGIDFMSSFGVMTGPKAIAERADQRIARGEYTIRLP